MDVIFVELEDPAVDSSGGIISYLKNLAEFMEQYDGKTYLIGVELIGTREHQKGISPFREFIPIMKKKQATNLSFIGHLFLKLPFLKIPKHAIIHSQRPYTLIPFYIFYPRNPKVCTLHSAHDRVVHHKRGILISLIYELLQWYSFRRADKLISVDRLTMYHYIRKYPWLKDKIVVIPIGVNLGDFKPMDKCSLRKKYGFSDNEKIILFVGRLEKEKNLDMLIRIFPIIRKEIKNSRLIFIGKGREENRLRALTNKVFSDDVFFWGAIPHDDIPEILNLADVLVLCSLYEGSPLVVKEAITCGLPVVSVNVGDVCEIIKDVEGCYMSSRDQDDLARKVIKVLKQDRRISMGDKALRLSFQETGRRTKELYKSLLKECFESKTAV